MPPLLEPLLEPPNDGRKGPSVGATVGVKVRLTNVGWIEGCAEGLTVVGNSEGVVDGGLLTVGSPEGEILGVMDGSLLTDGAILGSFESEGWNDTEGAKDGD